MTAGRQEDLPGGRYPGLGAALRLALLFALLRLAVLVTANWLSLRAGYGWFRDELYYVLCGRSLAWGYVDHGPLVALQARAAEMLFAGSLSGLRLFSELAGAAAVALTGLLCWGLGGSRGAQALAMSGYLLCPASLGASSFLSMISFEPVFWMTAVFALEMLVRTGGRDRRAPAWWLLFGLSAGLGMLNKISIVAFLLALLAALLLTPQRRLLGSRWCLAAVALAAAIELPNFCWQAGHGFPFREFLRNGHHAKMDAMPPLAFLLQQVVIEHPLAVLLWGAGVLWLLFSPSARSWRWMGLAYVFFLAGMLLVHAKDYYLSAVYPMVFAAGGAAWQAYAERSGRRWLTPAWAALLLATGLLLLPMSLPVLRPPAWVAYAAPLRRYIHETEKHYDDGPLPGQFADRLGWQQMADQVAAVYDSLPPAERAQAGILCQNYGEAGAINVLRRRRDLPLAISPHNNFYLWGTQGESGQVMIVLGRTPAEELRRFYREVEPAGATGEPYSQPGEHLPIFVCRGLKVPFSALWRHYYV